MEICDSSEFEIFQAVSSKGNTATRDALYLHSEKTFAILQFKWLYASTFVFAEMLEDIQQRLERIENKLESEKHG